VKRYGKYGRTPRLNCENICKNMEERLTIHLIFFHIFQIFSLFNLPFFHIFTNLFTIQPGGSSIFSINMGEKKGE
jgi:hypothetical protein